MAGQRDQPAQAIGGGTTVVLVASAAVASGLLVGLAVTAALESRIEFSLFLGIPAGLLASVLAGWGVWRGLTAVSDPRRRSVAWAVAGFSLAFLLTFGALVLLLNEGATMSLGLGLAGGLVGGLLAYLYARTGRHRRSGLPPSGEAGGKRDSTRE
jgi:hypothetical protein